MFSGGSYGFCLVRRERDREISVNRQPELYTRFYHRRLGRSGPKCLKVDEYPGCLLSEERQQFHEACFSQISNKVIQYYSCVWDVTSELSFRL